CMQTLEFPHSF
nr:immunoglobulin light chain junction region [Macaca mulatta]MOY12228.1 immunoglobulin light chain junction region [Macaca mulatta]